MHRQDIQFPAKDELLREDVHALGALVGEILKEQGGEELLAAVEGDRVAAIRRREGEAGGESLVERTRGRPPAVARDMVRAFSTWFELVNLAEKVHRIRRRRQYFVSEMAPQPAGVESALMQLRERGMTLEEVLDLLRGLRIEPVFTAHPTESTRRTLLRKEQRIAQLMMARLDPTLTPQEMRSIWARIRAEITIGWQTEEHPRQKLTVADEREHVLFYLAEVIYRIVPPFYEEVEAALEKVFGARRGSFELPPLLNFGSWVGGDMDGKPDVHAKTIRETLARQQQVIVNNYFGEVQDLAGKLSQSASRIAISPEMQRRIEEYATLVPAAQLTTPARHDRMPYRVFLGQVAQRLRSTYNGESGEYDDAAQFRGDIALLGDSLMRNRGWNAGLHHVRRLLRRIDTFGFHLATLDVRQNARVHHEVLAQGLADERWLTRSAEDRTRRLVDALERDVGPSNTLDAVGRRTLAVFEAMAQCRLKYGQAAIGRKVVSGASDADDVLSVLLLARWAQVVDRKTGEVPFDVAPAFETMKALAGCGEAMRRLLELPVYRRHLAARGGEQVALVGYSDSNKEAGIAASRWAIHDAQSDLVAAAGQASSRLAIFHARGGSISRGGGRIDTLIRSAPPGAVSGTLRVTEQGEVVSQSYGLRPIAMRTFERALNALALARATPSSEDPRHVAAMGELAAASATAYGALVHEAGFFDYFRHATPIDVIERMQIGGREAWLGGREGFEFLRPVPWVFAWTQSRHLLSGWYGMGAGLERAIAAHGLERLRDMYARWPFFTALVDDVEAMLARADLEIARHYTDELTPEPLRGFLTPVRAEFERASRLILQIKGHAQLLDGDPTLQRAIQLRNPYVDPMHLMQVDLLRRWRETGRQDPELFKALQASITGIAQGLQSSG